MSKTESIIMLGSIPGIVTLCYLVFDAYRKQGSFRWQELLSCVALALIWPFPIGIILWDSFQARRLPGKVV